MRFQPEPRLRGEENGFTLVELATVIAIIGILAAILIPTFSSATQSAKNAKTRIEFTQWATALENYRQEYGYYPVDQIASNHLIDSSHFRAELSGQSLTTGSGNMATTVAPVGNTKNIHFYDFGQDELNTAGEVQDAFGNTQIAILTDVNGDGEITAAGDNIASPPSVTSATSGLVLTPTLPDTIHARIVFYSAGAGQSAADIVTSFQ